MRQIVVQQLPELLRRVVDHEVLAIAKEFFKTVAVDRVRQQATPSAQRLEDAHVDVVVDGEIKDEPTRTIHLTDLCMWRPTNITVGISLAQCLEIELPRNSALRPHKAHIVHVRTPGSLACAVQCHIARGGNPHRAEKGAQGLALCAEQHVVV